VSRECGNDADYSGNGGIKTQKQKKMKQVTIENIIKSIASREIYDDVRRSGVYEAFFPDEELTNFLTCAVAQKLFVDVEYLGVSSGTYGEITSIEV